MKGKKILSCLLAASLCLSVSALPAAAASFPDAAALGEWAVPYIDDTVKKGIFVGIDGKFVPGQAITVSEVLVTCARLAVDSETRAKIYTARTAQIKGLMKEDILWFQPYAAVCLETGILTYSELKELYQTGDLTNTKKPITKEKFALYLVRGMQLEPMARNVANYTLDFADAKNITAGLEPYIYVLNMYGILSGNENKEVQPKISMNRAMAAKMLSVATDVMEENGTSVELPEYTDYAWASGTIVKAVAGDKGVIVLTLNSDLSGNKTFSIPSNTPIYQNSMLGDDSMLKVGVYARVNMDEKGNAIDVRLSGTTTVVAGSVAGISDDAIIVSQGSAAKTLNYDRFTEVKMGTKVGDRALIDLNAGYTTVTCYVDQLGHTVGMILSGGTHEEEGLLVSATALTNGDTTLVISGFDGQRQQYTVASGGILTTSGLPLAQNVLSSYKGSYVSLRASNDNASSAMTAMVDTATKYVQGAVKGTGTDNGVNTVTLSDTVTGKATTYKVADKAEFYSLGSPITYGGVQKDWFVTVRVAGGELAALWGYPGSSITEGTAAISYPGGATPKAILTVTKEDGTIAAFEFDLSGTLPEVQRSGKTSSMSNLRSGDKVKVTVRYNTVTQIEATPQSANVSGTIKEKVETATGVTITVELDNNGGTKTYAVTTDVSVTRDNGKTTISMYDLRVGYHVAMVTGGDAVSSIDVDQVTVSSNQITGTVYLPASGTEKTILFLANDGSSGGKIVTVAIPGGTTIQEVTGSSISLSKLRTGDQLNVYGSYVDNQFKATLVVRIYAASTT